MVAVIVTSAMLGTGCGGSPQVASDVPEFQPAAGPPSDAALPKGMPSNTTRGMQIDPATGRPMGPPQ